jgi:hypothetical protein
MDDKPKKPKRGYNPDLIKVTEKTRFEKGSQAAKEGARKRWCIRDMLRYVAAQEIDPDKLDSEIKRVQKMIGQRGKVLKEKYNITFAELTAIRMFEKAIKKMEAPIINSLIDQVSGKLAQEIILPPAGKAPDKNMTIEEAAEAYKRFINR